MTATRRAAWILGAASLVLGLVRGPDAGADIVTAGAATGAQEPAPTAPDQPGTGPALAVPQGDPEIEKAVASFRQGKFAEALESLRKATARKPDMLPPRALLAVLFFQAKQPAQGRMELEQAIVEAPGHPELYVLLGKLALNDRRLAEAALDFEKAAAMKPPKGWDDEKATALQRACRDGLATVAVSRQDWPAARDHLKKWLELEPRSSAARQRLAMVLFRLDQAREAFEELQKASKDDPKLEPPGVTMARFYAQKPDLEKAGEWVESAIKGAPKDPRAHLAKANWLLDRGEPDQALAAAEVVETLEPKSTDLKRLRGTIARYRKDYPTAERHFQELMTASPGDFLASDQLALVLIEQDDEAKRRRALELAQVNARLYPNLPQALSTLGWVAFRLGRLDDAEKALKAAASAGPIRSDTAYYFARVLSDRGQIDPARQLIKQALATPGTFITRADAEKWLADHPEPKPADAKKGAAPPPVEAKKKGS